MKCPTHVFWSYVLAPWLVWAPASFGDHLRNVAIGEAVPPFSLKTTDGSVTTSQALRGKAVVILFLAAEQTNSEQAARAAHNVVRKLKSDDLVLLFATADTARVSYFRQYRDKEGIHEPLGLDFERDLYGKLGLIVLPTTIGIDREGKLALVISGYKADYPHVLDARVRHLLGLIDDDDLEKRLTAKLFERNRPAARAARHRAAAALLREKKLYADAENELNKALEANPGDPETLVDLAWLHLDQKKIAEAGAVVDRIIQAEPANRQGQLLRGVVLFYTDDLDGAEPLLKKALLLNPNPARTHYYLGMLHEKRGNKDQAITHYREALSRLLAHSGK